MLFRADFCIIVTSQDQNIVAVQRQNIYLFKYLGGQVELNTGLNFCFKNSVTLAGNIVNLFAASQPRFNIFSVIIFTTD
jgi:hypothetical protein